MIEHLVESAADHAAAVVVAAAAAEVGHVAAVVVDEMVLVLEFATEAGSGVDDGSSAACHWGLLAERHFVGKAGS